MLLAIKVSSYPHGNKDFQSKLISTLTQMASLEEPKEMDASDIAKALGFV